MSTEMSRREFLLLSLVGGLIILLKARAGYVLTHKERRTLLAVTRTVFPHPEADNQVYVRAVAAIDGRCQHNPTVLSAVRSGITSLERSCGGDFANARELTRVGLLKERVNTPFFHFVYRETLESLYGSRHAWALFTANSLRG
jgi:hypothetical protein